MLLSLLPLLLLLLSQLLLLLPTGITRGTIVCPTLKVPVQQHFCFVPSACFAVWSMYTRYQRGNGGREPEENSSGCDSTKALVPGQERRRRRLG